MFLLENGKVKFIFLEKVLTLNMNPITETHSASYKDYLKTSVGEKYECKCSGHTEASAFKYHEYYSTHAKDES